MGSEVRDRLGTGSETDKQSEIYTCSETQTDKRSAVRQTDTGSAETQTDKGSAVR